MPAGSLVTAKSTAVLVGACVGFNYIFIGIAALGGVLHEMCATSAMKEEEERRRQLARVEARSRQQTKKAEAGPAVDSGLLDLPLPPRLHDSGTAVRVTAGHLAGREGAIAKGGYCAGEWRYVVDIDGEEWYVPVTDVVSTADIPTGAPVVVMGGKNLGRSGKLGAKHPELDLYEVVLEPDEKNPPKEFCVERCEDGKWEVSFGDTAETARQLVGVSGAAAKAGLQKGMVFTEVNGDALLPGAGGRAVLAAHMAAADRLTLKKEDGWYLARELFDSFPQ
eukprot:TRINITY_DN66557_c0_g1_i1.p1 TRINITY_DN66557_c0_g1~~TRINITY_DN66557_c0_g1_i1.p1  ORF type:complete len:311 (+),score=125.29 TRINITY_DN66557_c0_g1_i1:99-935(+)